MSDDPSPWNDLDVNRGAPPRRGNQAETWMRHTQAYLHGVDPALAKLFTHAMLHADWPKVSIAEAFEAILADFLAGPHRQRLPKGDTHVG